MITEIEKHFPTQSRLSVKSGWMAIAGGILYNARWLWELSEGRVKHIIYPPTAATQYFFIVQLLFLVVLVSLYRNFREDRPVRTGTLVASVGLVWSSLVTLPEAWGIPGDWSLYSLPGLAAFVVGTLLAGVGLKKVPTAYPHGVMLLWIGVLRGLAVLASILLFDQLGRGLAARQIASLASNFLLLAEGMGWIYLGVYLLRGYKPLHRSDL
ncbi:hypothetical protein [Telluribacter humicola]|uniref:hypothetical protein n=1 Tax=Telluribacter humicola TaxID=1720261 RepID=UPI001A95F476|nr:hypothetical protein [Telluribacter humicola]